MRDSIASLASGTYTVTRTATGSLVQGRYSAGAVTTFQIVASIQPATGRQLQDLPEGQRGDETVTIYTVTELRSRTPTTEPDVITYRGEPWTVVNAKVWDSFDESHCVAMACRAPAPKGVVP